MIIANQLCLSESFLKFGSILAGVMHLLDKGN